MNKLNEELVPEICDDVFLQEVEQSALPVMVLFYASWSAPCYELLPIVQESARQYLGSLKVVKIDIERNPITPDLCEVSGVPLLVFYRGGKLQERLLGAISKAELDTAIASFLTIS